MQKIVYSYGGGGKQNGLMGTVLDLQDEKLLEIYFTRM